MCNQPDSELEPLNESSILPYHNVEELVYNAIVCASAFVHDNQLDVNDPEESHFQFIAEHNTSKIIQDAFETAAIMTGDPKANAKELLKYLSKTYPDIWKSYNWCTIKGSFRQALIQFVMFAKRYSKYVVNLKSA